MADSNCNEPNRPNANRLERSLDSSALLRRTSWCGIVFALAIVLTCLNFMPPIDVSYHVRSKVVVSEARLGQLRDLAIADREAVKNGEQQRIQLLSVKVLDLADQEESLASEPTDEKVVLVEVGSLWANRCTSERHYTWLKNISKIDPVRISNVPAATTARFARWELEAAQHYDAQHRFLSEKESLPEPEPSTNVVASSPRQTFQLASFGQPKDASQASTNADASAIGKELILSGNADIGLQLTEQINVAKEQLKQAELSWQEQIERSSGALQIASVPIIAPRSTSIPLWMAASILVLGLAAGSSVGWLQLRQQTGGTFQPGGVAEELAQDSIPLAATLQLPRKVDDGAPTPGDSRPVIRAGRPLTRLSEWAVTFWVVLAVGRFFLDSVWRDVLVDSPLAALGRLMSGMP